MVAVTESRRDDAEPAAEAERRRKLRAKNRALLIILASLAVLFYVVSMIRIGVE